MKALWILLLAMVLGLITGAVAGPSLIADPPLVLLQPNPPVQDLRLGRVRAYAPVDTTVSAGGSVRFVNPTTTPIKVEFLTAARATAWSITVPTGAIGSIVQFSTPGDWPWLANAGGAQSQMRQGVVHVR